MMKKDWLADAANSHPNHSAIIFPSELILNNNFLSQQNFKEFDEYGKYLVLNYTELRRLSNIAAASFLSRKINVDSKVAVISKNNFLTIVSVLALWKISALPILLNPNLKQTELNQLLEISKVDFILTDLELNIKAETIDLENLFATDTQLEESNFDLNKTALVLFTSGTTSIAKGVELTFKNFLESYKAGKRRLEYCSNDRAILSLPIFHVGGFSIFIRALLSASSIVIPNSLSIEDLDDAMKISDTTLISLVPTQMLKFIHANILPPKNHRAVLIGGGQSDEELILTAQRHNWKIHKVYGSTETAAFVSLLQPKDLLNKTSSSGLALDGVEIKIVDEKMNELTANNIGQIIIRSEALMKGYLNNPDETKEKFHNDFYLTGDYGYLDNENFLYISLRRDDMIVTGGENVNPIEVESILNQHTMIDESCVIGKPDKTWGESVVAFVVRNDNALTEADLVNYLRENLSKYKIPKQIFFISEIPKTELGKMKREVLRRELRITN